MWVACAWGWWSWSPRGWRGGSWPPSPSPPAPRCRQTPDSREPIRNAWHQGEPMRSAGQQDTSANQRRRISKEVNKAFSPTLTSRRLIFPFIAFQPYSFCFGTNLASKATFSWYNLPRTLILFSRDLSVIFFIIDQPLTSFSIVVQNDEAIIKRTSVFSKTCILRVKLYKCGLSELLP